MVTIEEQRQLARVFGRHQTGAWGDLSALPYVVDADRILTPEQRVC